MFPAIFNALLSDIVQHVQRQELGGESGMEETPPPPQAVLCPGLSVSSMFEIRFHRIFFDSVGRR